MQSVCRGVSLCSMATTKTRKTKVSHRGVQLLPPRAGRTIFFTLKWRDPSTRGWRYKLLRGVTAYDAARPYAVRWAHALDVTRRDIEVHGRAAATLIAEECARYIQESSRAAKKGPNKGKPLAPATVAHYTSALAVFQLWCQRQGLRVLSQLTRAKLSDFRELAAGDAMPSTINFRLKPVRQMLVNACVSGRFESLDSGAVAKALAAYPEADPEPVCIPAAELKALLRKAINDDLPESRPRARPDKPQFGPALAVGLLGGLRRGEAAALRVDSFAPAELSAHDRRTTHPVLRVGGKTGKRTVELLPYSPLLVELLAALTAGRPAGASLLGLSYKQIGARSEKLGIEYKSLRSTCATYQQPLPGDEKRKADRLGHTIEVAVRHYLALPAGTPISAPSLDAVMGCEAELREIIAAAARGGAAPRRRKGFKARNVRAASPARSRAG